MYTMNILSSACSYCRYRIIVTAVPYKKEVNSKHKSKSIIYIQMHLSIAWLQAM